MADDMAEALMFTDATVCMLVHLSIDAYNILLA